MQYFFILGRNPELSLAELQTVLPSGWKSLAASRTVVIAECAEFDVSALIKRLGGTVKIGKILDHSAGKSLALSVKKLSFEESRNADKKIFLGLSAYALDEKTRLPSVRELRELGIKVKRELQAQDKKVRLVTSKEIALSSVIVEKEKLLRQGAEIVLLYRSAAPRVPFMSDIKSDATSTMIGKTLAVQEFEIGRAHV